MRHIVKIIRDRPGEVAAGFLCLSLFLAWLVMLMVSIGGQP